MDNQENPQEFNLDDILSEFQTGTEGGIPEEAVDTDFPIDSELKDLLNSLAEPEEPTIKMPELVTGEASGEEASDEETAAEPVVPEGETIRFAVGSDAAETPENTEETPEASAEETPAEDGAQSEEVPNEAESREGEAPSEEEKPAEEMPDEEKKEPERKRIIYFSPQERLRDLKKKLIAGPEKRYYDLVEIGVGKLQLAIFANILIVLLCVVTTTFFTLDMIPENRLRFVIFSQVLALLVSGLLGSHQMLDGISDVFCGKFTLNTLLTLTFTACCVDAVFCLRDLRVPCCSAFALEMTFALFARYHRRRTEMNQMDTLRKAVQLQSIVKDPEVYDGKDGFLRGDGDVEDFTDTYDKSSGPETTQCVFAFICLIASLGIAALAGVRHNPSLAVQVLSTSLLVSCPASFFVAVTRPTALLERRLHMVGSVICGWQGVKKLCGKAVFPIRDEDLFPTGSIKLNGIKFYGDVDPDLVLSYTTSLISEAGGGLVPVFRNMLTNRGCKEMPVLNFRDYGTGGIGGEIDDEPVLLGTLQFLQDMGVEIPQGTTVSQAVYVSIDGQLSAVVAISYARMRSAAAGLVSLAGNRKIKPVLAAGDFLLTDDFIRSKFSVRTRRMEFPAREVRAELAAKKANPETQVLALSVRGDLVSSVYPICGARALRTSCRWGVAMHILGGIIGLLTMFALAYQGSVELLTPTNVLLYQLIWMVPGFLITEWTRTV